MSKPSIPGLATLASAFHCIKPFIHKTPVLTSSSLNALAGSHLYFKCENFQRAGAYKIRGAIYAVHQLGDSEKNRGVATHSSGNFAQALALTAKLLNLNATIVMPENAPEIKKNGVLAYGAQVVQCQSTLEAREKKLKEIVGETGASFIHPSNDMDVITGHSSATFELAEIRNDLQSIVVPVGGGGLLAGTCLAAHHINPAIEVFGVEPKNADDAFRSLKAGKIIPVTNPQTIADGLRTSLGDLNFPIIRRFVKRIILVEEQEIIDAMRILWERLKIIVEPSSAVTLAGVLKKKSLFKDKHVGLILTGGNVDLKNLPF